MTARLKTLPPRIAAPSTSRTTPAATPRRRGSGWMSIRAGVLQRDGWACRCDECAASGRVLVAHEVDHIVPLVEGGTDDPGNLRAINRDCHKAKTAREGGSRGG